MLQSPPPSSQPTPTLVPDGPSQHVALSRRPSLPTPLSVDPHSSNRVWSSVSAAPERLSPGRVALLSSSLLSPRHPLGSLVQQELLCSLSPLTAPSPLLRMSSALLQAGSGPSLHAWPPAGPQYIQPGTPSPQVHPERQVCNCLPPC